VLRALALRKITQALARAARCGARWGAVLRRARLLGVRAETTAALELADIEPGVDSQNAAGKADPARLFHGGWSWGGHVAAWTLGHTDRYRAFMVGAGVTDVVINYVTSDINHGLAADLRLRGAQGRPGRLPPRHARPRRPAPDRHGGAALPGAAAAGGRAEALDRRRHVHRRARRARVAEKRGREDDLRRGVEALCGVLGVELTEARRRELAKPDAAELEVLLARLGERQGWR
jgi:hypothetical protein